MNNLVTSIHNQLIASGQESSEPSVLRRLENGILRAVREDHNLTLEGIYSGFGVTAP
jgi:hypothetical protein